MNELNSNQIKELIELTQSIYTDEFRKPITNEISFEALKKEIEEVKKIKENRSSKINQIIEYLENSYSGDFFQTFPVSDDEDELDVICMGLNTYVEELSDVVVSKEDLELANKQLNLKNEAIEKLSKQKDEFIAAMSHELRTPLNGIIGFTNILIQEENISTDQKDKLLTIKKSSDILLMIINDILGISQINNGNFRIENKLFDLKNCLENVYSSFEYNIYQKGIDFTIQNNISSNQKIISDERSITQLLINLISNAVKFSPNNGKIKLSLEILKKNNSILQIIIEDNGVGIPEDKLKTIFEPFVQAHNNEGRKTNGTGLGLTLVKRIVELLNGEITVESEIRKGTKFTLNLPIEVQSDSNSKCIETSTAINKTQAASKKLHILVAEDNQINQLLMKTVLEMEGYSFFIADNGLIATEKFQEEKFDIILMDLMMPVMNGYEATSVIRNIIGSNVPIIAVSADVTSDVKEKCKKIGMNSYISKPFKPDELIEEIKKLISTPLDQQNFYSS